MEAAGSWVDGVEFPATKVELIEVADEAGAADAVIERLQQLEREQYESRAELDEELAG